MPAGDFVTVLGSGAKPHDLLQKLFVVFTGQIGQGENCAGGVQEDFNEYVFLKVDGTDRIEGNDGHITGMVVDEISDRHIEKGPHPFIEAVLFVKCASSFCIFFMLKYPRDSLGYRERFCRTKFHSNR